MRKEIMEKAWKMRVDRNLEGSISEVNKLISRDPRDREALLFLADTYLVFCEFDKAMKAVEYLDKIYKGDKAVLFIKSWILLEMGKNQEAKETVDKLYGILDQEFPDIIRIKGLCEYRMGNRSSGIDLLEESLFLDPTSGNCLVDLIEMTCAEKCFTRSRELIKMYHDTKKDLEFVGWSMLTYDEKVRQSLSIIKNCEKTGDTEGTIQDYSGGYSEDLQSLPKGDNESEDMDIRPYPT